MAMWSDEDEFRRAVAGLPIDDQPRRTHQEEAKRRVLRAYDEAMTGESLSTDSGRLNRPARRIMRNRIVQIGVAAAAACVVLAVAWPFGPASGVAFARVQEIVAEVRTVCFDFIEYRDGQSEGTAKVMFMEPGRMRTEWPGLIAILDWNAGKILSLSTEDKSAHRTEVSDMKNPYQRNWVAALKSVVNCTSARELGDKQLSGRQARGWQVPDGDGTCAVWVDASSGELLQAEFERGRNKMVMTNFVVNPTLDEAQFDLAPPAGYTLVTDMKMSAADPSEADIILLLKVWASGNGGQFPDRLDGAKFAAVAAKADWPGLGIDSTEKGQAASKAIGRAFYLLHSGKLEWGYVGKGVKVGQKEQAVFWCRATGAQNYRVICAEFSVMEVSAEKLQELIPSAGGR